MGQLDQSAADCKKALELNPDDLVQPIMLSRNLSDAGTAARCFA